MKFAPAERNSSSYVLGLNLALKTEFSLESIKLTVVLYRLLMILYFSWSNSTVRDSIRGYAREPGISFLLSSYKVSSCAPREAKEEGSSITSREWMSTGIIPCRAWPGQVLLGTHALSGWRWMKLLNPCDMVSGPGQLLSPEGCRTDWTATDLSVLAHWQPQGVFPPANCWLDFTISRFDINNSHAVATLVWPPDLGWDGATLAFHI